MCLLRFKYDELQFATQLCSPRECGEKDRIERSRAMFTLEEI